MMTADFVAFRPRIPTVFFVCGRGIIFSGITSSESACDGELETVLPMTDVLATADVGTVMSSFSVSFKKYDQDLKLRVNFLNT